MKVRHTFGKEKSVFLIFSFLNNAKILFEDVFS